MAKFLGKYLGEFVLMTAAALWAGCDDSERNDGSAKQDNPKLVHPWDTKKFFDEKPEGNLLEKKEKRRLDSLKNIGKLIDTGVTALYGVYVADSMVFANASAKKPPNSKGLVEFPDREKIQVAEESSLDKESIFNVLVSFTPGLRHIYSIRYLKKNSDKHFEGEITLKLTIAADGSVKENQIKEQKAKQETAIDNLLSQYQYEFEQKTEKVGFWKGLANKFTKISTSSISNCCNNKIDSVKGFRFIKYKRTSSKSRSSRKNVFYLWWSQNW